MIQINLKRKQGNNSVTFGILSIPQFGFKCVTMELLPCHPAVKYKHNCGLPAAVYTMKCGFSQGEPMFPLLVKKPHGFAVRPKFNLEADSYNNLPTGDICLGKAINGNFGVVHSNELTEAFCDIFRHVFGDNKNEIVVLNIVTSAHYKKSDICFIDEVMSDAHRSFIEEEEFDDEEEQTELENDADNG